MIRYNGECYTNGYHLLTAVPISVTYPITSLMEGAFRKGKPEKRSEGGARARTNALRSRADPGQNGAAFLLMDAD